MRIIVTKEIDVAVVTGTWRLYVYVFSILKPPFFWSLFTFPKRVR
jgi:hypothetical protein